MTFAPIAIVTSGLIRKRSRSEEHTSELQSRLHLVCRLLLEKKKNYNSILLCLNPLFLLLDESAFPPVANLPAFPCHAHVTQVLTDFLVQRSTRLHPRHCRSV